MTLLHTRDFGLEGAAGDVVRAPVFNADQVVSRGHWRVLYFEALRALLALHLHL